jgi:hypothetical protein
VRQPAAVRRRRAVRRQQQRNHELQSGSLPERFMCVTWQSFLPYSRTVKHSPILRS